LVATDIAARGIDVSQLELVVNYDLPNIPETYVHRIGRTGRASASGNSISFCDVEEKPYLKDIQKLIRQELPVVTDHPFLPGGVEDVAVADEKPQRQGQRKRQGQGSRSSKPNNSGKKEWRRGGSGANSSRRRPQKKSE